MANAKLIDIFKSRASGGICDTPPQGKCVPVTNTSRVDILKGRVKKMRFFWTGAVIGTIVGSLLTILGGTL